MAPASGPQLEPSCSAAGASGLGIYENFVYANDESIGNDTPGESAGVIRFDLENQTATRFQYDGGTDVNLLTVGSDGNLYALGNAGLMVIDPISM